MGIQYCRTQKCAAVTAHVMRLESLVRRRLHRNSWSRERKSGSLSSAWLVAGQAKGSVTTVAAMFFRFLVVGQRCLFPRISQFVRLSCFRLLASPIERGSR